MLDGLKRLLGGATSPAPSLLPAGADGLAPWAAQQGYTFRGVQDEGFVIEGRHGTTPWRLEWGPSQRPYITGHEVRLRAEMGLPSDLQMAVMNRVLQEDMEKAVFEQYVEGVQTRIDNRTPPEMRWLVMFGRLTGAEMGPLHERFVALAAHKGWLTQWLDGPLAKALSALPTDPGLPMVLMIGRGRMMLRTALEAPDPRALLPWLRLFQVAIDEARRVAADHPQTIAPSVPPAGWEQTQDPAPK